MPSSLKSIGQVLAILKGEFEDISISKIRFLETEGLVSPERAPSGYRKYSESDIERLRYILRVQRDNYLPLKVIREHLDAMDNGELPPEVDATPPPVAKPSVVETQEDPPAPSSPRRVMQMSRRELMQVSGLADAELLEMERLGLVQPRPGTNLYGREALTVCVVARKLSHYGMNARHLKAIQVSAEREVGLVEQAVQPFSRRSNVSEEAANITQLVIHAHAAMMHMLLER